MSLTVLSVAFPYAPVGPAGVGGAERILAVLDEALVRAGQRSLVVACGESVVAGELVPVVSPAGQITDPERATTRKAVQAAIDRAIAESRVDVVHLHGLDFHEYRVPDHVPVIVTLHLPIPWYQAEVWSRWAGRARFCCVSQSQRRTAPPALGRVSVIENGVAVPKQPPSGVRGNYAVTMGRICPEKNAHEALEAGTRAGLPVVLIGQVFPYGEHQQYFAQAIEPRLGRHVFLGPLPVERRTELLAHALCLLHPTLAPETSSLVAMEALAVGTPVIAYRSGALADIVEDGVTGFLVNSVNEMADAIRRVDTITPEACHRAARERFSERQMIDRYLATYTEMATGRVSTRCA